MNKLTELMSYTGDRFSFDIAFWAKDTVELRIKELIDPLGGECKYVFYTDETDLDTALEMGLNYIKSRLK